MYIVEVYVYGKAEYLRGFDDCIPLWSPYPENAIKYSNIEEAGNALRYINRQFNIDAKIGFMGG
jgi:hypothetical protein